MNNVNLTGRLVYDPEIKEVGNEKKKLSNRLAVPRNDKAKTVDFINVQAWNNTAVFISKYFHKGDPIEITGRLQVNNFERSDGTKASEVFVLITEAGFVLSKGKTEDTGEPQAEGPGEPQEPQEFQSAGGVLPFEI